jgi:hypothetical protein
VSDQLVPTTRTTMTPLDVLTALRSAWLALGLAMPSRAALLTLLAQWSLETGGGFASKNWNLAGIKHTQGDGHDYARYLTEEVVNGQRVTLEQDFRAYASLDDGAFDYLRTLRKNFAFAWPAVEAGEPEDFAHRLKIARYYTAPEEQYAAGLRARYRLLDEEIAPDTVADTPSAIASNRPIYVLPDPLSHEVDPDPAS